MGQRDNKMKKARENDFRRGSLVFRGAFSKYKHLFFSPLPPKF